MSTVSAPRQCTLLLWYRAPFANTRKTEFTSGSIYTCRSPIVDRRIAGAMRQQAVRQSTGKAESFDCVCPRQRRDRVGISRSKAGRVVRQERLRLHLSCSINVPLPSLRALGRAALGHTALRRRLEVSFRPFAAGKLSVNPRCPPFMTQGVGSGHSMTAIKEGHAASLAASQAGFTKSIGDDADADGAGHGLNERVLPRQNNVYGVCEATFRRPRLIHPYH